MSDNDRLTFRADEVLRRLMHRVMAEHKADNVSDYIRGIILDDYQRTVGALPEGTRVAIPAWLTAENTMRRKAGSPQ